MTFTIEPDIDNPFDSPLEIDWNNVKTYFLVKKASLSKGFAQAPSQFRLLLTAKGAFAGTMQGFAFDED
jgi:hypothetical protein